MKKCFLVLLIGIIFTFYGFSIEDARLLRFPDINKELVAFVYAGDIWTVPSNGGNARRLTSHKGIELLPKISPDGKWIAFSGEYSGSRQIFIIPSEGGEPRQLTYYNDAGELPPRGGFDHIPLDWTSDSKQVLFRANRTPYENRKGKYYLVSIDGGMEKALQIPQGEFGTFSPDQKKIVYNPKNRSFRTWKRYKGGLAQDIWIYDLINDTSEQITTFLGTDQQPVWYKDKIYFLSDRDLILNFWSYDLKTKDFKQITHYKEYDVLWPSGNENLIAFENGGYINLLDLNTGNTKKITVNINYDSPARLPYFKNVSDYVSILGADISPDGTEAVFDARGDLFTVPAEKGVTLNITRTQEYREMYPTWSPDGKWIAIISDRSGDYEIYLKDPKNEKPLTQLTQGHKIWKTSPIWSPDSRKLLFFDSNWEVQMLDIQTKKITVIDKGLMSMITNFSWSGDSQWVVYSKEDKNRLNKIWVYSLEKGKSFQLSSGKYHDSSPVFSQCGKYIFFVSDRDFDLNLQSLASLEFDFVYNKTSRIYAMALTKDAPNLFKEQGLPELKKSEAKGTKGRETKNKREKKLELVAIDFDGITSRVSAFPMSTGNYSNIADVGGKLLFRKDNDLYLYDMKSRKEELVIKGVQPVNLSKDRKKLLYQAGNNWGIITLEPNQKPESGRLKMDGVVMKIDPAIEWKQMFNEGWRIVRDWFYSKNMHGVDWQKIRNKYAQLIPYVSHPFDLTYVFGEMMSELNVGHAYVEYSDFKEVTRIDNGLLGAVLKADIKAGRYKIAKIYKGENWEKSLRSPLTEQGVDVKEGDYIIKLDGQDVFTKDNPYKFLENKAEKEITITVNDKPTDAGARTSWIKPIKNEQGLRYLDWVESRREMVDRMSNGRIAYIHIPNTAIEGHREFFKGLYAYSDKEAFIFDDRYNTGGFTPVKMINKMAQRTLYYLFVRELALAKDPTYAMDGPMVMLINHTSGSGGDDLPYLFRHYKLGKLIGTRTWGGLVGIGWNPTLVDGSVIHVPSAGFVNSGSEFIVEGMGVYPDEGFEVIDRPEEIVKGKDPTVEKAVKYLLEELKKNPTKKVKRPELPNRSGWHEKMKDK